MCSFSNGRLKTKIVKLFELDFAEDVNVAESLGDVTALENKQGVVSDDTCRIIRARTTASVE